MKRLLRCGLAALAAVSLCLSLTGCLQTVRLQDRAIVQAVGVDYQDGKFQLTFQYFLPEGGGSKTAYDPAKLNNGIIESEGDTMTDAVDEATRKQGKQLFFGSNKVIIIGGDMAKEGVRNAVDYFNSNHQLHPSVYMMVTPGKAKEIVSAQIPRGIVPASSIEQIADTARDHSHLHGGRMVDVVSKLQNIKSSVDMPLIRMDKTSKEPEVYIDGAALFKEERLVDFLSDEEVQGALWLTGKTKDSQMVLNLGELGKCSLQILSVKSKMHPRLEGDHIVFDMEVKCDSTLRELNTPSNSTGKEEHELIKPICDTQERKIRQLINLVLNKTVRENKTDIFRLNTYIRKYLPEYFEAHQDDFDSALDNMEFKLKISCNISRMGLDAVDNKR